MIEAPKTLGQAEERFKSFLLMNSYPQRICWITSNDLIATSSYECWVRRPRTTGAMKFLADKFIEGISKGIGVELRAICASDDTTFATIFVPRDQRDAELHLMNDGLKMSCPVERTRARVTGNPLHWLFLSRRDAGRSSVLFK